MVRTEQCAKAEQCKWSRAVQIVADPTRSGKSMSAEQTRTHVQRRQYLTSAEQTKQCVRAEQ